LRILCRVNVICLVLTNFVAVNFFPERSSRLSNLCKLYKSLFYIVLLLFRLEDIVGLAIVQSTTVINNSLLILGGGIVNESSSRVYVDPESDSESICVWFKTTDVFIQLRR
jgi:hypothetical protein